MKLQYSNNQESEYNHEIYTQLRLVIRQNQREGCKFYPLFHQQRCLTQYRNVYLWLNKMIQQLILNAQYHILLESLSFPFPKLSKLFLSGFLSHIRDYIVKKLMTWKNHAQFTVMKTFQMVGRKISLSLSRICHENFPLIFHYVPSSEDPYFIIANQKNIKPIMKETFTLQISLCKKRYHQISFHKIGKGEKSFCFP